MAKIIFEKVDFHYPEIYTPVFEKVSICVDTQWRLGLIGRNGRGKTTLLRLMSGELSPTAGKIKRDVGVEYFPYHYSGDVEITLDVIKECIWKIPIPWKGIWSWTVLAWKGKSERKPGKSG